MNSWDKSDSIFDAWGSLVSFGANDLRLANKLAHCGSDDRKFLRQIFVCVDITAPLYWWKEFDTYKVGTVTNSCSTMHKIHSKKFEIDDFSHDRMSNVAIEILGDVVNVLEERRQKYLETEDKSYWDDIIQLLPTSYNQKRTCTLNYENLLNQYNARKEHKLMEWREYCKWVLTLPWFPEICMQER